MSFSIEINSKEYLDKISIFDDDQGVLGGGRSIGIRCMNSQIIGCTGVCMSQIVVNNR
jgi:hypothetical protein